MGRGGGSRVERECVRTPWRWRSGQTFIARFPIH